MDASDFTSETLIKWGAKGDRWHGQDTAAGRFQRAAQSHIQAGQLWQQAAHAYAAGDHDAAKTLYGQAQDASALARDHADQASMI